MAIKTNAAGMDLRRGLIEDGSIKLPSSTFTQKETFHFAINDALPDGVWAMNPRTYELVVKMLRLDAAAGKGIVV